ncbi:hypothetical protein ACEPAG_9625 [Sanghuangporus baumii]
MQVHNQRRIPSSSTLLSAKPAAPLPSSSSASSATARARSTTINASSSATRSTGSNENPRIASTRSYRSLRDMSSSTAAAATVAPVASNSGSRSRSGSSARFLSVNTQAASSESIPNVPQMSGHNVSRTPDSIDGSTMSPAVQNSASSSSPASAIASSAVGSPTTNGTHGQPQQSRDRSLTHKNSSRTIGGSSVLSVTTNSNVNPPRKTSPASALRPSGASKEPSRTREKEKTAGKALGRSRTENRDTTDEDDAEARILRMLLHDTEPAPPTLMYWSRAPVWGALPTHKMRSHSATVVDNTTIWMFGGCDDKEFWRDVLCLDVETMECTMPETNGDVPPPCRAHTATLVDRRLFVFGGGQGNMYYNSLYILDTAARRWTHVPFSSSSSNQTSTAAHGHTLSSGTDSPSAATPESIDQNLASAPPPAANNSIVDETLPRPRRAHTTVLHKNRLVVFGGGNGAMALNDVWVLDVSVPYERMRWVKQRTVGTRPSPRGYHTANLVGNVMVVVGGSDGRQTFADIFCLDLDTWHWSMVHTDRLYRRLAHTATQIGSYLFIMGGHDGSQYTNELLLFNLVSLQYEPRHTRGIPPSPRGYHAAALADGRLWAFGGYDGRTAHDDVYMLDLASSAYLSQVTGFQINVD